MILVEQNYIHSEGECEICGVKFPHFHRQGSKPKDFERKSYPELENAPTDHHSEEFLEYLRQNNKVIWENPQWLVIANCKYHRPDERPWYTAFHKGEDWWKDVDILWFTYGDWAWLKKPLSEQTVKRFHIHIYDRIQKEKNPPGGD